jgi:hypothetical protein
MNESTGRLRGQPELALPEHRQDAPLETDERPDERVQCDQQRELARVRAQSEAGGHPRLAATISR